MLKILVISDTHYTSKDSFKAIKDLLIEDNLSNYKFDGIIHCGDIQGIDFYEELLALNIPIYAVLGNNDDYFLYRELPPKRVVLLEKVTIGIIHGDGDSSDAIDNAKKEFLNEKLDLVCFGHSHIASLETVGKKIFFNPGSFSNSRKGPNTYGIIEIDGKSIKIDIQDL